MPGVDSPSRFSLSSVCWGYRDIFRKTIERLISDGYLGDGREEVTGHFYALMRCAEQGTYDHLLKEFLDALTEENAWIFDLPAIFEDVVRTGCDFAAVRMYHGIQFFRLLADGRLGDTPERVQYLLASVKRLRTIDEELAFAFLKGYSTMLERLRLPEIDRYVEAGLRAYARSSSTGLRFMECRLGSCELLFREITRECRLTDLRAGLSRVLRALAGRSVEVGPLSALDGDDLMERAPAVVCADRFLFLPDVIRAFDHKSANEGRYLLQTVVAAGMFAFRSFPVLHGLPGCARLSDAVGADILRMNLLAVVEYVRVLEAVRREWPGSSPLIDGAFRHELARLGPLGDAERLFFDLAARKTDVALAPLREVVNGSADFAGTAEALLDAPALVPMERYPRIATHAIRAFSFLPDFLFPVHTSPAADASLIVDLKDASRPPRRSQGDAPEVDAEAPGGTEKPKDGDGDRPLLQAAFLYDEWNHAENDYFRNHCQVREDDGAGGPDEGAGGLPSDLHAEVAKVRRIFELLKPALAGKMKRLADGDEISHERLVDYVIAAQRDPSPKIDFYERPRLVRRDLSVLILLDVSGSTDEEVAGDKILDIEKKAALILGEGLGGLGDRFSICGFSGKGREDCRFHLYKSFAEPWNERSIRKVLGACPSSSTRMGAALRHSGYRIGLEPSRQKLIILITDGRPMDAEYDPDTRYAQHDVRMACEENRKRSIYTYCVSTMENSRADMEIMFPERRFVILHDIRRLPFVLPELYIRLTT